MSWIVGETDLWSSTQTALNGQKMQSLVLNTKCLRPSKESILSSHHKVPETVEGANHRYSTQSAKKKKNSKWRVLWESSIRGVKLLLFLMSRGFSLKILKT